MARDFSKAQWHYALDDGGRRGPVPTSELLALAGLGAIQPDTMVSFDGATTWQEYSAVADLLLIPPPPPLPTTPVDPQLPPDLPATLEPAPGERACALCHRNFAESELLRFGDAFVCADCKPLFVQKLRAGQALPQTHVFAGFWIRVGAKLIDGLILYVFNIATTGLLMLVFGNVFTTMGQKPDPDLAEMAPFFAFTCGLMLLQIAVAVAYTVFFLTRFGATPGKIALKLKVIRSDGSAISTGRAFGRHFGDMLSGMVLGIGYLLVAFDEEKRSLHDHLCDTRVIRTQ